MTGVPTHLQHILEQAYPAFSEGEIRRRRAAMEGTMAQFGVDHALIVGAFRVGPAIGWLTGWPVTQQGMLILTPGEMPKLFIQYYNHLPNAREIARDCDVEWGLHVTLPNAIEEIKRRGGGTVGILGSLSVTQLVALKADFGHLVDLGPGYGPLRLVKSDEELDWMRIGAAFSDMGVAALADGLALGMNERQLGDLVERAYIAEGGLNVIHFMGVAAMDDPDCCVPRQYPRTREVRQGDMLSCEITANFWDHGGQVLRSFTIGADPTPLYKDLHDTAEAAFAAIKGVLRAGTHAQEIVDAATLIDEAGFTIYDDLVHGFGGGYLPPILGIPSRPNHPVPDMTLEAGMVLVVQPNVITPDERAGVQTGEALIITEDGTERLHDYPEGLGRIDP